MAKTRKPIPKSQEQLSQSTIEPYTVDGINSRSTDLNRGERRSVKNDNVKSFSLGLKDIDETIVYYFNNIIQPSVIQNGRKTNVPILYGSPERWSAVQKDGFYRDKNGKIQAPLIMYKRDSLEKNRQLGNKLDANNPLNFGVFTKKFSKKNIYDKFSVLNNREPIEEYYGIVYPDYVNITYSCIVFTDYIEQMNKIVESINFASDSYWGDKNRFTFRAMIDSINQTTSLNQGEDRKVRSEFTIKLLGHIVADSINAKLNGINKYYSKSAVKFKFETVEDLATLNNRSNTPERQSPARFFDSALTGAQAQGTTVEQTVFLTTNNSFTADIVTTNTATFSSKSFINTPPGYSINQNSFDIEINGVGIAVTDRTVSELGNDVVVVFDINSIGYDLEATDEVTITGKLE